MNDNIPGASAFEANQIHQIRNRLTVVKGVAQLLDRQVRRDDWRREKIVERVDRLQDEIAELEVLVDRFSVDEESLLDAESNDLTH